jgi:hypothetical protein
MQMVFQTERRTTFYERQLVILFEEPLTPAVIRSTACWRYAIVVCKR